ncbi:MAG: bifunctional metallophosphatase/5'-nucleotidase [Fimbriimonadaceae bacterium]
MNLRKPMVAFLALATAFAVAVAQQNFTLTVLHTNDIHARVEPAMVQGRPFGGYARLATLIERYRQTDPNVVVLDAGDVFQGTLYFNVYEGLAEASIMNIIGFDAMAAGNHEFDKGPGPLRTFIDNVRFPVLGANLDVSAEPLLRDKILPSTVLEVGGERIGIVGAMVPNMPSISSPGPNVRMLDWLTSVQAEVDRLTAQGIDKVILLSHSGYDLDVRMAPRLRGVDLIVGGHSHTLLGRFDISGFPRPGGEYPTVLRGADGAPILVVQAWQWGILLGRIQLEFDDRGRVAGWREAAPIPVDESVEPHPKVAAMIAAFQRPIAELGNRVVGEAPNGISRSGVRERESPMSNLIADAMLEATRSAGSVAAFMNAGGVRADIEAGPITFAAAIAVQPFNNTLVQIDLTGEELRQVLEQGAGGGLMHPSRGTVYQIDRSAPRGRRVTVVTVGGQPWSASAVYRLTFNSFNAGGGDGHEVLRSANRFRYDTGLLDIDALIEFIQKNSPVDPKLEGRIRLVGTEREQPGPR